MYVSQPAFSQVWPQWMASSRIRRERSCRGVAVTITNSTTKLTRTGTTN